LAAPSRWFDPSRHADRRPFLMCRNRIVAAIRQWFAEREFVEVDSRRWRFHRETRPISMPFRPI